MRPRLGELPGEYIDVYISMRYYFRALNIVVIRVARRYTNKNVLISLSTRVGMLHGTVANTDLTCRCRRVDDVVDGRTSVDEQHDIVDFGPSCIGRRRWWTGSDKAATHSCAMTST